MKIINEQFLMDLSYSSQALIPNKELESLLVSEENEVVRPNGVPAHYYRFFYFLMGHLSPARVLELGTYTGISSYCLASQNDKGQVVTVDQTNERILKPCRDVPNIIFESRDSFNKVKNIGRIDLFFIDTVHDGERCQKEFDLYKDNIAPNGIVFFDDVYLNEAMKEFWVNFNPEGYDKFDLPVHGKAGFGTLIKHGEGEDDGDFTRSESARNGRSRTDDSGDHQVRQEERTHSLYV